MCFSKRKTKGTSGVYLLLTMYDLHTRNTHTHTHKVLSKAYDHSLGGRDFDRRLMEYFSAEFKSRTKIDSLTLPRQTLRLTYECERLKKSMGTVTQPVKLSLECFANDKDLSGSTKRLAIVMCRAEILRMDQRVFASYILVYNPMLIRLITSY